jgi:peroxiredoxin
MDLVDTFGKSHTISEYAGDKGCIVVFLGTECPLVKAYTPKLNEIAKTYADRGMRLLGVVSNHQDTLTEITAFVRTQEIAFPVLKDIDHRLADAVGAVRTPEAVLLDSQRVVLYHGRIDDQIGVGYRKGAVENDDLVLALDHFLKGESIAVASTPAPGCLIGRTRKVAPTGTITYSNQIARLFQNRCERCHREGEIGPFTISSYQDAVDWADNILETVDTGRMPPWFASSKHHGEFRNEAALIEEEKNLIRTWVANGCPEGDPKDLPAKISYVAGWQIKPDQIWKMADEPFVVPAEGTIAYKYYEVDLKLTEDKWIKAAECRPGVPSVVHHVIIFLQEPGVIYPGMPGELVAAYAPGFPPTVAPEGMATRARKGSKVIFQMHYTADGVERKDISTFGVQFADPKDVQYRMHVENAVNFSFKIPAYADNVSVVSSRKIPRDVLLLGLNPHMHQRGKAYTYEAQYPDGRKEVLLDVPRFDFNWQIPCVYNKPKELPAGTKIVGTGIFDNSTNNLSNPDPSKDVKWGDQTWEEMQIGWYTVAEKIKKADLAK